MPILIATDGPLKGQRFDLLPQTIIGRSFDADIRIDDLSVSRHHCRVSSSPQGYVIEDLGSGNGTLVNDDLIDAAMPLKEGDIVVVSNTVFRFVSDQAPDTKDLDAPAASVTLVDAPKTQGAAIMETLDVKATMITGRQAPVGAGPDVLQKALNRLRTVVEIGNAVGTHLEMDDLLNEIMRSLFNVFPQMDRGFIMLREEGTDEMQAKVARQRDKEASPEVTVSKHIIEEAVQRGVAVLSADAMGDQRFSAALSVMNFQIRSMMCAPLISSEQTLGVIHLDTMQQDRRFTLDDLELFTAVANQTALALGNARMHQRLLKRERMERDLALARRVQHSFLPGEPPKIEGLEFAAHYKAALEVGGDFYDWIPLNDGRLGIVLGDVAGKGIPAALMMARMMSDVRFLSLRDPCAGKVLEGLNEGVIQRGMEDAFVTVVFMILDPDTHEVAIANAAHCPPILRTGRSGELVAVADEIGFPIGAMPGGEYGEQTIALAPGDSLTFFTDGVTEALNAEKELYGDDRVLKAMAVPQATPASLVEALLQDIHAHVQDTPQSDDLTVVSFGAV